MTDQEIRLKFGEMNAGEMRLARALVAWHEREITKLNEDLTHAERWRDKLDTKLTEVVEAAEQAGWDSVENSKNLPTFITYLAEALSKAQAELAALRQSTQSAQPILADDGRSLGRVAFDKYTEYARLRSHQQCLELVAQKVADVVLAQAVRRMEEVPVDEIGWIVWELRMVQGLSSDKTAEAVRARLIAAAKGEGQVQLVVVNEPPQDEGQPDLSGEGEKQTEPAWIPHYGGPCPLKDEEVEMWQAKWITGAVYNYKELAPSHDVGWDGSIIAFRVLKWKPGFGPEAKAQQAEPAQAQQEPAQPWTPAVGDTVRLKSGGPVMTVTHVDPLSLMCAWMNADNELQVEPITTLCLEPAQP